MNDLPVYDRVHTVLGQTEPGEDEVGFAVRQIKREHDYWSREGTTSR